ncbi:MAG: hypothetical protein WCH99_17210 [Verrucomicrobiota bacterium]
MTPFREIEMLQAKRVGLQALLDEDLVPFLLGKMEPPQPGEPEVQLTEDPSDLLERSALEHAIGKIDARLKELADKPKINPQAEMFFVDGQVTNHHGLEITFASDMLKSYQNMVTNHYAAKNFGLLRKTGRRHGEADAHLFLTALPRGSFGMQLSQPQITDWVAAGNVSKAMEDLSGLVDAAAESDPAFEGLLLGFNPRVLTPLKEFMKTLNAGGGSFRLVTGMKQVKMNHEKIQEAYWRVSAASSVEREITIPGTFGGITGYSCEFDFRPHVGEVIKGPLAEEITEEDIERMNHDFTFKPAFATLKETTVTTRSGKKKPTFELIRLTLIKETPPAKAIAPAPAPAPAATPPKELPPTPAGTPTIAVRPKLPKRVPQPKAAAPSPAPVTPPPPAPKVQPKTPPKTEPPTNETPPAPDKK